MYKLALLPSDYKFIQKDGVFGFHVSTCHLEPLVDVAEDILTSYSTDRSIAVHVHVANVSFDCYATNERQLYEEKLHEETVLSKSLCRLLNKASHLTAFYALHSSLHLPVTPAQLMRPGIGRNASCAVGGFA